MKTFMMTVAVVAGLAFVTSDSVEAGHYDFRLNVGTYGNNYGFSYSTRTPGCRSGYRSYNNYYRSPAPFHDHHRHHGVSPYSSPRSNYYSPGRIEFRGDHLHYYSGPSRYGRYSW